MCGIVYDFSLNKHRTRLFKRLFKRMVIAFWRTVLGVAFPEGTAFGDNVYI